jgi:P-type E1-E2 ATPase
LSLSFPEHVTEEPGRGIAGIVDGRKVAAGSAAWLHLCGHQSEAPRADRDGEPGRATIAVAVDGRAAGAIEMADRVREDAPELVGDLRAAGIEEVAMVTGDRAEVGVQVGRLLGIDRVFSDLGPEQKVEIVRRMQAQPGSRPVIMVGDGVNDAPALALADVGIAMGTIGATVSSETADAVIMVDRVDRVVAAVRIGRRSLSIARQSVLAGMGLSLAAMGFAAAGLIVPIFGALLQEAIDVAVILNALRALRG